MTQPAKVQEPSMEEILASIRRIIADDEAKPPPGADKPAAAAPPSTPAPAKPAAPAAAAPAVKPPVMGDVPPSKITPAPAATKPAAPPPPAPPPPAASNSQDDIDALLNGLDETTTEEEVRPPQADGEVLELTDDMAVEVAPPPPQNAFQKVEPDDDLEFAELVASKSMQRPPAYDPPPVEAAAPPRPTAMLSTTTVSAVEVGVQHVGPHRAQQQRADAGGPGQGDVAADAEILARRQSAGAGGAHRQGRNRAGLARPLAVGSPGRHISPDYQPRISHFRPT